MKYHFTYDCVKEILYHIEVKKLGGPLFKNIAIEPRLFAVDRGVKLTIAETKVR